MCIHCRGVDCSQKCQYAAIVGNAQSVEMMQIDQMEAQKKHRMSQKVSIKEKEDFASVTSIINSRFHIHNFPDTFPYPRWMEQQLVKSKKDGGINLTVQNYKDITSFMGCSKPKGPKAKKAEWMSTLERNGGWREVILKLHSVQNTDEKH